MKHYLRILAIETSCDETAAAVLEISNLKSQISNLSTQSNKQYAISHKPLSNIVASQIDIHKEYGGVFPELASRAHLEKIIPVICKSLKEAGLDDDLSRLKDNVDAIAVTQGPGLIGSLLVGVQAAKTLAATTGLPLYPINHLEGHVYVNCIHKSQISNLKSQNWNPKSIIHNSGPHSILRSSIALLCRSLIS